MNQNNKWKWALVVFLVAWSLWEIYPPQGRDLIEVFKSQAVVTDTNFNAIVAKAEAIRQENLKSNLVDNAYVDLRKAIGTNELKNFFTTYDVTKERDPNVYILNQLQHKAAPKIKLGLDLRGGTSFLMGMDTSKIATNVNRQVALDQAIEVLRRRVDKLGVAEPVLQKAGEDRILIQLPGISEADKESARRQLQKAAFLELRMVHPRSEELLQRGIVEPGYEKLTEVMQRHDKKAPMPVLVKKKPEHGLTGKYITKAYASRDPMSNRPEILFSLDTEGTKLFAQITKENVGQRMAIVLDGELISAPNIQEPITGGSARITGDFTPQEALELANTLQNPLEAPVKVLQESSVDPSLGKDAIRSGIYASIIGVAAVVVFMAVYYLFAGVVANFALMLNIIILIGVMCSIGTTLTLPGIAGVVLTIGMAVDANVLIFERIREELEAGKSMRGALIAGYDKAFGTIFDSNLTTLISSVILIFMGTGPVKGFGVTLTIGLCVSMFTALVVTRLIFDWMLEKGTLKTMKMFHLVRGTGIKFMKWAKPAFAVSWLLILVGVGWGFKRGHDIFGVDFAGGDTVTLRYHGEKPAADKVREAIDQIKIREANIQYQKDVAAAGENLKVTTPYGTGTNVVAALEKSFPNAKFETLGIDAVGPIVGEEIQKTAVVSTVLALFGILVYVAFRYEFSFSVGAVVAIIHDILMTLGWFFLSGRQLSAPMVAAILTIIGFSINDTIVIFDRIREDLKLGVKGTFTEVIDKALGQTLSRTIITSGTVFLATLSLYLFGGGVINDFAFTFLVGIVTGTYSSIYIASALVLWWHKGERPTMGSTVAVQSTVEAQV